MRELDANALMFFDRHLEVLPLYQAFEDLIVVSKPEELDEELFSWIREAYAFADAKGGILLLEGN